MVGDIFWKVCYGKSWGNAMRRWRSGTLTQWQFIVWTLCILPLFYSCICPVFQDFCCVLLTEWVNNEIPCFLKLEWIYAHMFKLTKSVMCWTDLTFGSSAGDFLQIILPLQPATAVDSMKKSSASQLHAVSLRLCSTACCNERHCFSSQWSLVSVHLLEALELKINWLEFLSTEGNIFLSRLDTHLFGSDIFSLVSMAEVVS